MYFLLKTFSLPHLHYLHSILFLWIWAHTLIAVLIGQQQCKWITKHSRGSSTPPPPHSHAWKEHIMLCNEIRLDIFNLLFCSLLLIITFRAQRLNWELYQKNQFHYCKRWVSEMRTFTMAICALAHLPTAWRLITIRWLLYCIQMKSSMEQVNACHAVIKYALYVLILWLQHHQHH